MPLGSYDSAAFTTAAGVAVAATADVEVRRESDGALASIFSDRAGATPIAQPGFQADATGRFIFYAAGIADGYQVKVTKGAETHTARYQATGTAREYDASTYGASVMNAADAAAARVLLDTVNPRWHIGGLTYANNATDATNDIDIAVGKCRDSTDAVNLAIASALVKRLDASWVTGTNQGGLSSSLTIGNNDYYIHVIRVAGVDDIGFDTSPTAANLIADHSATYYRLVGWFKRVGGTIVAFKTYEIEGGGLELLWTVPTLDVNLVETLGMSERTDAVKVPLNFSVLAHLNAVIYAGAPDAEAWVYCPDQTSGAPTPSSAPLANLSSVSTSQTQSQLYIRTSATGTIAARASVAGVDFYGVVTVGFQWARRN